MEVLGITLALGGFFFGLYQFSHAQKWKRSEYAATQLGRLRDDQTLAAACKILDWRNRTIQVPGPLRIASDEATFDHTWETLEHAVKPESERHSFDRTMALYRDIFDALFTFLEEINHCINIGLVSVNQVWSLKYWVQQIAHPRFGQDVSFAGFIDHYGYSGVRELMIKFGIPEPPRYTFNPVPNQQLITAGGQPDT